MDDKAPVRGGPDRQRSDTPSESAKLREGGDLRGPVDGDQPSLPSGHSVTADGSERGSGAESGSRAGGGVGSEVGAAGVGAGASSSAGAGTGAVGVSSAIDPALSVTDTGGTVARRSRSDCDTRTGSGGGVGASAESGKRSISCVSDAEDGEVSDDDVGNGSADGNVDRDTEISGRKRARQ